MNVQDSIFSNTYFVPTALHSSEMAESTQREDLATGEECHEETGVGGSDSKISLSKTERGLDL